VKCIYILKTNPTFEIESLLPQEQIVQLIQKSYGALVFTHWLKGKTAAAHLRKCVALANSVPLRWLKRPRDLGSLGELAQAIEVNVRA
jgi:hypothetical protein